MMLVRGLDFGVSPGFRHLFGLDEDLAEIDARARAMGIDPATIRGGTPAPIRTNPTSPDAPGVRMDPTTLSTSDSGDFINTIFAQGINTIFGQGSDAGRQFSTSVMALQTAEAARERARALKLVGSGLLAIAILGGGLYAISRFSKR